MTKEHLRQTRIFQLVSVNWLNIQLHIAIDAYYLLICKIAIILRLKRMLRYPIHKTNICFVSVCKIKESEKNLSSTTHITYTKCFENL